MSRSGFALVMCAALLAGNAALSTSVSYRELSEVKSVSIVCNALDLPEEFDLPDGVSQACDTAETHLAELALSRGIASHVIGPDERANLTVSVSGRRVEIGSCRGYVLKIKLSFLDQALIPRLSGPLRGPYTVATWSSTDADLVSESDIESHLVNTTLEMARWFFDDLEKVRSG
jgi:hypothetical protein